MRGMLIALCVQAAVWAPVLAQEKPEPPQRSAALPEDSTTSSEGELPKIDLPEFLITGNEAIQLPQFDKTAIDEQKVFDPSSRKFGPGMREPSSVELSGPNPGKYGSFNDDMTGKVLAGYGSYATPYFDGWVGKNSQSSDFLLKAGYKSSNGHITNADYRSAHSSLSAGFYLPDDAGFVGGGRIHASAGLQGDGYRLYGGPTPSRERTVTRFMADAAVNSDVEDLLTFTSGLYVRTATVKDSLRTAETSMGFEFAGDRDLGDVALKGELGLWRNFYSAPSAAWDPYHVQAGLSARYRIAQQVDVLGGLRMYLVRGSDTEEVGRFFPRLGISWYAVEWMTVFARFDPYVQRNTLSSMVEANPYVVPDLHLRNQEFFTNLSMGVEADPATGVRAKLAVNYKQAHNYPVFEDTSAEGLWHPVYDGAVRILSLDADLYADVTEQDNVGASVSLRSTRWSETGAAVPYLPRVLVSGLYQHRFPFGLTLGTTMQIIGSQYADRQRRRSLAAFTLWEVHAEYAVAPRWAVNGTVQNLLNQKQMWWEGYAGLPRTASLGMSFTW